MVLKNCLANTFARLGGQRLDVAQGGCVDAESRCYNARPAPCLKDRSQSAIPPNCSRGPGSLSIGPTLLVMFVLRQVYSLVVEEGC